MNDRDRAAALSWRARGRRQLVTGTVALSVLSGLAVGGVAVMASGEGAAASATSGTQSTDDPTSSGSSGSVTQSHRSGVARSSGS